MRDSDCPTLPHELSASDLTYHDREQKVKRKALVQMHTDFAPILEVLFHTAVEASRTRDTNLFAAQLLKECHQSIEDLCTMLLEHFGKHIVQPRRDLFEKATHPTISQSSKTSFLT